MKHNGIITANRVIYQEEIFPELKNEFGYFTNKHEQVVQILDMIDLNEVLSAYGLGCIFWQTPS